MAGYIIYSLDWDKFQAFTSNPTDKQLRAVAKTILESLDGDDVDRDEAAAIRAWRSELKTLCEQVKERLGRPDWYGDLGPVEKSVWSAAVEGLCSGTGSKAVGFRVDDNGIDWDALELAWKQLNVEPEQVLPGMALSAFGRRPFRYHPPTGAEGAGPRDGGDEDEEFEDDFDDWPRHSMHTPDEVRAMRAELESIRPATDRWKKPAIRDYETLVSVLERLDNENRMLYVQVDT